MEYQSGLGNPFQSDTRMMVGPQSGMECESGVDVLTQVKITGQFVFMFVDEI